MVVMSALICGLSGMKDKLTQEYLKECMTYDPDTGIFTWNTRPESHFKDGINQPKSATCKVWNLRWEGKDVGAIMEGYICTSINKKMYRCHRLAFLYMEGYLPENNIDHINRVRNDNRWVNLREVSTQCNLQNCNLSSVNTSGVTGVLWDKSRNKWTARMMIRGKNLYLGRFENFEDAVMARYKEELNNPNWTCSVESTAYKYLKERNLI